MSTGHPDDPSRRRFLGVMAAGAVGGVAATSLVACSEHGERVSPAASGQRPATSLAVRGGSPGTAARRLVVIELPGGNDGLSTLVPIGSGRYHDLRPTLALSGDQVIGFDHGWGLNSALAPLQAQGLAVVAGVGVREPSLSHFDMLDRWWTGVPNPSTASPTGFLGRLCDRLGTAESITGMTIGILPSRAMRGVTGNTTARPDVDGPSSPAGASTVATQRLLATFGQVGAARSGSPLEAAARSGVERMLAENRALAGLPPRSGSYPAASGSTSDEASVRFGEQLALAARFLRSELGVRVVHISVAGVNFDTHDDHAAQHRRALDVIVPNLEAFRADLAAHGVADEVLIATTSEFGRRVAEHNGGLDHGAASCALLMGPVAAGLHGEPPSLTKLDRDGNLTAALGFDRYYATLAEWMGVDPADVLASRPRSISGVLTT